MLPSRVEKVLRIILIIGLILTLFTPFIVSDKYLFPFIVPRAMYFQLLTEILFGVFMVLIIFFPQSRPKATLLSLAVLLFLAAETLSTVTSADPGKSLMGSIERSFGLFHLLHYGVLFIVAKVALRTRREWNLFLALSLAISLFAAIFFLLNYLHYETITSVAGNPTFIAAYFVIHFFFALYLFTQTKNLFLRIILVKAALLLGWAMLFTQIRGVYIGLAAALIYLFFYAYFKWQKYRITLALALLIPILLYTTLFFFHDHPMVKNNTVLHELTNFSLDGITVQTRWAMWKTAIAGFEARPLTGWGRDNYSLVFNTHYDSSFGLIVGAEDWEDRAHNAFLEALVNSGIVGFLAFLFLNAVVFFMVRKNPLFFALFLAYTGQSFFGVETINSYLPLFLFFAFVDFLSPLGVRRKEESLLETAKGFPPLTAFATSSMYLALTVLASLFFTLQPVRGNLAMSQALRAMVQDNVPAFEQNYRKAKNILQRFPSLQSETLSIMGISMIQHVVYLSDEKRSQNFLIYLDHLISDLKKVHQRVPEEQIRSYILAKLMEFSGFLRQDEKILDETEGLWRSLMAASPERQLYAESLQWLQRTREEVIEKESASL